MIQAIASVLGYIIRFFYEEHKRTTDIAEELKVSKPYITKIIQKDERYIKEKEYRSNNRNAKRFQ